MSGHSWCVFAGTPNEAPKGKRKTTISGIRSLALGSAAWIFRLLSGSSSMLLRAFEMGPLSKPGLKLFC